MNRVISWFSHGVASAVATKLALVDYDNVEICVCEIKEEHKDNKRFREDCEKWFGKEIKILGNDEYKRSILEVFWRRKYLSGVQGAPCTLELKKKVREGYERPEDIQIMGYTVEEQNRVDTFIDANPDVNLITPLIDRGLTHNDCLAMVQDAGIELPVMYKLGFEHNNCIGCVKSSGQGYWAMIREHFPKRFKIMAGLELITGARLVKIRKDGEDVRINLLNLPNDIELKDDSPNVQCGIFCHMAEQEYK